MRRLTPLVLAGAVLIVACQDSQVPTTPDVLAPSMAVSDGAHQPTGGPFSNPDFFFLPPLVTNPVSHSDFEPGEFNPGLGPRVRICQGEADCPGTAVLESPASLQGNHYQFNWKTSKGDAGNIFRVHVVVGGVAGNALFPGTVLGYLDVSLAKGSPRPAQNADDNARVNAGSRAPIKFSIENDALCFDPTALVQQETCASATITTTEDSRVELPSEEGGLVAAVDVPDQTDGDPLPPQVTITMEPCEDLDLDIPLFGDCVRITTDPPIPALNVPAIVSICGLALNTGLSEEQEDLVTLIHQSEDGSVTEALPHAQENCETVGALHRNPLFRFAQQGWRAVGKQVARLMGPKPAWASAVLIDRGGGGAANDFESFFQFALPAKMEPLAGTDGQAAPAGTPVPIPPGVLVTDLDETPVAGATVHFEVTLGTGTVTPVAVMSNSDGIAQLTEWELGDPGANQVRAFGFGIANPQDPGPFMPDILLPTDQQVAVDLETGEVFFNTVRVAGVGANLGNVVANAVFSSGDLAGTITRLTAVQFNALTPAQLREQYDVLIITWASSNTLDVDWDTRLLPYLQAGGGVLFDGDPNNVGDLGAVVSTSFLTVEGESPAGIAVTAAVPGLTDGINDLFANNHIRFATFPAWDPALSPFMAFTTGPNTGAVVGLHGRFEAGCIVMTGPDQDFHGVRGGFGSGLNQYNLLVNEIRFARTCP